MGSLLFRIALLLREFLRLIGSLVSNEGFEKKQSVILYKSLFFHHY